MPIQIKIKSNLHEIIVWSSPVGRFCFEEIPKFVAIIQNVLAKQNLQGPGLEVKIAVWAILFVAVYLFMHVGKLSEFIQSDEPGNTLLLTPNELGTVFERLETLEELEI